MLWWHKELWLIDHGASLYFHHTWEQGQDALKPFPHIKDHVFLQKATDLESVDADFRALLTPDLIRDIVSLIPEEWLTENSPFASVALHRQAYTDFLVSRVLHSDYFVKEAQHARESLI